MRKSKTTFSIRSLLAFATLAGIATFYFTFERSASLIIPPTAAGRLDESKLRALNSNGVLQIVVSKTEQGMLPRPLRGAEPNYGWFRKNLSVVPNSKTNEIDVKISTNQATAGQLELLIDELSKYRVESRMQKPQSRIEKVSDWVSSVGKDVQNQIYNSGVKMMEEPQSQSKTK